MATAQISPIIRHIHRVAGGELAHLSDSVLLDRFADQHDNDAFEILVRRHGGLVFGVCQRVLLDSHAAEDCFQSVFLVLASKARSLHRTESLGPWLHAVAVKFALRARRRSAFRRAKEREAAVTMVDAGTDVQDWRDVRPILDDAIARLPRKYRIPFVLCHVQGRTVSEIARQLELPRGTVATHLLRAREQLRGRLVRRGVTLSAVGLVAALSDNLAIAGVRPLLVAKTTQIIARNAVAVSFASKYSIAAIHGAIRMSIAANLKTLTAIGSVAILGTCLLGYQAKSSGLVAAPVANRPGSDDGIASNSRAKSSPGTEGEWLDIPLLLLRRKPILVYRVGPGDTLGIVVDGIFGDYKELPRPVGEASDSAFAIGHPVPVREDGTIATPRVAPVKVEGMTIPQVCKALEDAYSVNGMIPRERLDVTVTLYRKRTIRVLVIRQDDRRFEQRVGGPSKTYRGTGKQLELPLGENDLLIALAKTGGMPGMGFSREVFIKRAASKAMEGHLSAQVIRTDKQFIRIPMESRDGTEWHNLTEEDIILHDQDVVFVPDPPIILVPFLPLF